MAGNLGYQVDFVLDATSAFDGKSLTGEVIPGATVMQLTAANLNGEFARVASTADLISELETEF